MWSAKTSVPIQKKWADGIAWGNSLKPVAELGFNGGNEYRRRENRGAMRRKQCWEGLSPSPPQEGLGRGSVPFPEHVWIECYEMAYSGGNSGQRCSPRGSSLPRGTSGQILWLWPRTYVLGQERYINIFWHHPQTKGPTITQLLNYLKVLIMNKCKKKLQFIHKLTASDISKTAKITKRWYYHIA